MIVVDTNVISEVMKQKRDARVWAWWSRQAPSTVFTTAVSEAEILYGIALLPQGKRRTGLQEAAEAVFQEEFAGRVLPFDTHAALAYARIAASRRRQGLMTSVQDAQIAGIASAVGASLATRNVADFERCGIDLIDPWASP
jgi:toxin FitB